MVKFAELFGVTLRETPGAVEFESHGLLLRAGFVRQLAAGIFTYMPLAWRAIRKIDQILREEMERIGGQEMNMPVVHPAEIWQQTGRYQAIDETMVRFKDRGDRDMVLAMTHEEVVAQLLKTDVQTYRQLPRLIFHIQTKFRDEARARGGLIRVREFAMKDSYSLDVDHAGLERQYIRHYEAYFRIGRRVALPLIAVRSDVGMMGGKVAHEFMYLTDIGEDTLATCGDCGYAANREVALFRKRTGEQPEMMDLEEVHTPGKTTIGELSEFLGCRPSQCAKIVCYVGDYRTAGQTKLVLAVVRGDLEVNQTLVQNLAGADGLRPAHSEELAAAGLVAGYASPIGIPREGTLVVADDTVAEARNLVAGANKEDFHLKNTNYGRDYEADVVGNIAVVYEGAPCAKCGAPLELKRGVEVGNIFQLGTRYSEATGATFVTEDGESLPVVMGSYGIGVGRLLACIAEEHRDDSGFRWPVSVAPYQVHLVALARKPETAAAADALYEQLQAEGFEVLFDDRDVSPGIKFADCDLLGMPLRLVVSDRGLKQDSVEFKLRTEEQAEMVPRAEAVARVKEIVDRLTADIDATLTDIPAWDGQ